MPQTRDSNTLSRPAIFLLDTGASIPSISQEILRLLSASPHRTPDGENHAQDLYKSTEEDGDIREDLLLMEKAWANEPGRSFLRHGPTLPVDHPQSDRPAGRRKYRTAAHAIARGIPRLLLVTGQIACITIDHAYERCHHGSIRPSPSTIQACDHFKSSIPISLHPLIRTSTPLFVVAALTHGTLATKQYHLNRNDSYQDVCLNLGLVIGLIACLPSLADPAGRLAIVSTLTMAVTLALTASALGHFIASSINCRMTTSC